MREYLTDSRAITYIYDKLIQLIDEETIRRKFILSSCAENDKKQNETETARLSLKLAEGCWNLLEIDLQSICQKTYRTEFRALQRLIIYANCRIRRIYLQDRHYEQNETPVELCQAFFDMYMLKWGINFVEKSSQTDKTNQVATKASKIIHDVAAVADAVVNKRKLMPAAAVTGHSLKLQRSPRRNTKSLLLSRTKNDLSASTVRTKKERSTTRDSLSVSNDTAEKKAKIKSLVEIASTSSEKAYTCTGPESIRSEEILNGVMLKNPNIIAESLKMCTIPERKTARTLLPFIEPTEIPSEVEAEATENVESKQSKLLTTDEAVRDFLELRHAINSTILENFRVRGLTMTEVELSIYNSKNRRNSYGQGQLIEKHRTSVDKACHVVDSRHKIY